MPNLLVEGKKKINLISLLSDMSLAPSWRDLADKCCEYYDCNQLSDDRIKDLTDRHVPLLVTNLIKPVIDIILGIEEKSRTVWKAEVNFGDDTEAQELAEALSYKLFEAERETNGNEVCGEAFESLVKAGIGWVEVGRNSNPFLPKYRLKCVHRNEIDYDWRSRDYLLDDARYIVRRKWFDNDILQQMFPKYKDIISRSVSDSPPWEEFNRGWNSFSQGDGSQPNISLAESEFYDRGRDRTCLFEVWYRVFEPAYVIQLLGRAVEFDRKNPVHVKLYEAGLVQVKKVVIDRIRQSIWIGATMLFDRPSPYKHRHFPYVPFFCFREDKTGIPFGPIRAMLSPQDEFNARRAKMYELLSLRRVIADDDAVLDHDEVAKQIASPAAYIRLNPNRRPESRFEVQDNVSIAKDQYEIMLDAAKNIVNTVGIQQTLMNPKAVSGLAKQVDIDQGQTTLAKVFSRFRTAKQRVGELLLSMIKEDIGSSPVTVVKKGETRTKVFYLNQPSGDGTLRNDVQRAITKIVLDEAPVSSTFRQQILVQLMEVAKSLPPQVQGLMLDFIIESTDMPKKNEMARRIRRALNISEEGDVSPQEQALQTKLQEMQASFMEQMQELEKQKEELELALKKEKAKGYDIKRDIEEIKLEKAKIEDPKAAALEEQEQSALYEDLVAINDKVDALADTVMRIASMLEQSQQEPQQIPQQVPIQGEQEQLQEQPLEEQETPVQEDMPPAQSDEGV